MVKIIFLDCDGVLNSDKTCHFFHEFYGDNGFGGFFDSKVEEATDRHVKWGQDLVDNLKYIIDKTDAQIVISSTWRVTHLPNAFPKMFAVYGWKNAPVIDKTPRIYNIQNEIDYNQNLPFGKRCERGHEIQYWLDRHPEVTNYVILDDNSDMLESQSEHFVQTDERVGLSREDAEKAIKILLSEV